MPRSANSQTWIYLFASLASLLLGATAFAEPGPAGGDQPSHDSALIGELNSLCATHVADHTFVMVGNIGCLQGSVGPEKVNFVGIENLDTLVVRSSGGFMEQLQPLIMLLSERDFLMVVPEFCLSACAMYLLPLADRVIVAPGAVVASHGAVFSDEEKYTEYFLTSRSTLAWRSNWAASHPDTPHGRLEFDLRRMYFSYQSIKNRVASALASSGADPVILDAFEGLYECAGGNEAAKLGDDAYIELDLHFYSQFRDTSLWAWPQIQGSKRSAELLGIEISPCTADQ